MSLTKAELRLKLLDKLQGPVEALKHAVPVLDEHELIARTFNFTAAFPSLACQLFNLHGHVPHLGSRLGRGEVLIWFLYDDVTLGGSSSTFDVIVNGEPILEVKCGTLVGDRYHHFMLGIDEVPASLSFFYKLLKLFEKNDRLGKLALPENFANISKTKLNRLREVSASAYQQLEDAYFTELLEGPVGSKHYLIFEKDTGLPVHLGKLRRENLQLERISGGLTRLSYSF